MNKHIFHISTQFDWEFFNFFMNFNGNASYWHCLDKPFWTENKWNSTWKKIGNEKRHTAEWSYQMSLEMKKKTMYTSELFVLVQFHDNTSAVLFMWIELTEFHNRFFFSFMLSMIVSMTHIIYIDRSVGFLICIHSDLFTITTTFIWMTFAGKLLNHFVTICTKIIFIYNFNGFFLIQN